MNQNQFGQVIREKMRHLAESFRKEFKELARANPYDVLDTDKYVTRWFLGELGISANALTDRSDTFTGTMGPQRVTSHVLSVNARPSAEEHSEVFTDFTLKLNSPGDVEREKTCDVTIGPFTFRFIGNQWEVHRYGDVGLRFQNNPDPDTPWDVTVYSGGPTVGSGSSDVPTTYTFVPYTYGDDATGATSQVTEQSDY
jgi:hypothetical protein